MRKSDATISYADKAVDWTYLNEGNLNIVCKYTGSDPRLSGYVLRVKKNTHSATFSDNYGIPEPEYRQLFRTALQPYPNLLSFFPEDV